MNFLKRYSDGLTGVSRSGYYQWLNAKDIRYAKEEQDKNNFEQIQDFFELQEKYDLCNFYAYEGNIFYARICFEETAGRMKFKCYLNV